LHQTSHQKVMVHMTLQSYKVLCHAYTSGTIHHVGTETESDAVHIQHFDH
jgi:hypothetical protein